MRPREFNGISKIAKATASCSKEASVYGACINAKYLEVEKGMCEAEFQKFKQCVTKAIGRKW